MKNWTSELKVSDHSIQRSATNQLSQIAIFSFKRKRHYSSEYIAFSPRAVFNCILKHKGCFNSKYLIYLIFPLPLILVPFHYFFSSHYVTLSFPIPPRPLPLSIPSPFHPLTPSPFPPLAHLLAVSKPSEVI